MKTFRSRLAAAALLSVLLPALEKTVIAADNGKSTNQTVAGAAPGKALVDVLSPGKWKQVEGSVDRALSWLAQQQVDNGSFPSLATAQPAVTSFCVLAFLSRGHQPGSGPYGQQLNRAVDFVVSCQKPNGLFSYEVPEREYISRHASHTATYNHAIAGLMLGEVYGHVTGERARRVRAAIEKALQFTRAVQIRPKGSPLDKGGWRYLWFKGGFDTDSDLSVTAWQLMFLRSARNAEFNVPREYVDEAIAYVQRCWDPRQGVFAYTRMPDGTYYEGSRGMMGAGILSLSLAGQHETPIARTAGDWLLAHPYRSFGQAIGENDRFFYSAYYCSQAAAQLGGRYWEGIFPPLVDAMLSAQSRDGSWPAEPNHGDAIYGNSYTTALAVLALTPPYQLLPVYQR